MARKGQTKRKDKDRIVLKNLFFKCLGELQLTVRKMITVFFAHQTVEYRHTVDAGNAVDAG